MPINVSGRECQTAFADDTMRCVCHFSGIHTGTSKTIIYGNAMFKRERMNAMHSAKNAERVNEIQKYTPSERS